MKRARMCVYLDVELSDWIKKHAIQEYRSFSSFLNVLMLNHKEELETMSNSRILSSEIKN